MALLFVIGLCLSQWAEWNGNPLLKKAGVAEGMNMEGKEVRFGTGPSALWGQATSVTSNGSVNAMHDSMLPVSGLVFMFNIAVGEVIFGGVGVGLIGMLMYVILAMFLAGLMIGRTPEFLGKKLEVREMIMAVIVVIVPSHLVASICRPCNRPPGGPEQPRQPGPPRPVGSTLCVLFRSREQRIGIRRTQCKHCLL